MFFSTGSPSGQTCLVAHRWEHLSPTDSLYPPVGTKSVENLMVEELKKEAKVSKRKYGRISLVLFSFFLINHEKKAHRQYFINFYGFKKKNGIKLKGSESYQGEKNKRAKMLWFTSARAKTLNGTRTLQSSNQPEITLCQSSCLWQSAGLPLCMPAVGREAKLTDSWTPACSVQMRKRVHVFGDAVSVSGCDWHSQTAGTDGCCLDSTQNHWSFKRDCHPERLWLIHWN